MKLPQSLSERVRKLAAPRDGEFVLYWMRTAMRGHHNPALDVALALADDRDIPAVVLLDVGRSDGILNDRRLTFILEAAADVADELRERGVRFLVSLTRPDESGLLEELAARASSIVCEDLPVPWHIDAIHERLEGAPVLLVDTACVVPMQLVPGAHNRAYRFRNQHRPLFAARNHRHWEDWPVHRTGEALDLPTSFDPADIEEARDVLGVDGEVQAVADTRGGSVAGYARWESFRARLDQYHRRRNDAADPHAVSRMSAYIHFGMVSPFVLALNTAETSGDGARKYVDELVTWREFAHHVCFTTATPPGIDWIPDWALDSLQAHEDDPRPAILSRAELHEGRTGDELWDLAQQSLIEHGELHNNLRMTWGKQLLLWTRDAETAVELAIELNDTYALDGQDPNSYLGLLWCFGAFDRPFSPEQDVFGTVRPRTTEFHARRIDVDAYRDWINRTSTRPFLG